MSTKIYTAWRMPITVFYKDFIPAFREHCFANVVKRVDDLAAVVLPVVLQEVYNKYWKDKVTYEEFEKTRGKQVRVRHVLKYSFLASRDYKRNLAFSMDCSFNTWFYNNKAYVIPYGESWTRTDFIPPEKIENYCYWNNTDEPKNVTRKQWEARGDMWDKICLNDWNKGRMLHEVVNIEENIGNVEIWRKIFGKDEDIGMALLCEYDVEDIIKKIEEKKIGSYNGISN